MSAPVRPEPDPARLRGFRARLEELRERFFSRGDLSAVELPAAVPASGTSRWLISLMAGGAALLTLGVLLGYQSWSDRSAPAIDDQLPALDIAAIDDDRDDRGAGDRDEDGRGEDGRDGVGRAEPLGLASERSAPAAASPAEVIVHVAGAVVRPGVVSLPAGSRVYRAIELSGGAATDADLDRVNLAAPVIDGERIHVPQVGEDTVPEVAQLPRPGDGLAIVQDPVDVNTADASELEALPGIGPSLAQAIVTTRLQRGPFRSIDELVEVPGIGEAKLSQLADQVTVS